MKNKSKNPKMITGSLLTNPVKPDIFERKGNEEEEYVIGTGREGGSSAERRPGKRMTEGSF
jgi:hypothetical protein